MSDKEQFFNIYLWIFPENNKLIKIEHLTRKEAEELSNRWYELNELHDYMLVTEVSTPFGNDVSIEIKPKEWLLEKDNIDNIDKLLCF